MIDVFRVFLKLLEEKDIEIKNLRIDLDNSQSLNYKYIEIINNQRRAINKIIEISKPVNLKKDSRIDEILKIAEESIVAKER